MAATGMDDFEIPDSMNWEETFESYEVFEALARNVVESFLEGEIKDESVGGDGKLNADDITEPAMIVVLTKIGEGLDGSAMYEAAQGPWSASPERFENVEYILPVINGEIKEVYLVNDRSIIPGGKNPKVSFTGKVADDAIRDKYVGMDVSLLRKKGQSNPFQYFNV